MANTEFPELNELLDLDMEYRLTVGVALAGDDEKCASYFARRRDVLIPEILMEAKIQGVDPVNLFADYARKVHARFCEE